MTTAIAKVSRRARDRRRELTAPYPALGRCGQCLRRPRWCWSPPVRRTPRLGAGSAGPLLAGRMPSPTRRGDSGPGRLATIPGVVYDQSLSARIRELLAGDADVTEMKMFGGLAFLVGGNLAVAASGQGGVMVRVDPAKSDSLVTTGKARLVEMRGRPMQGWLRVDTEDVRTKRQLANWVTLGMTYARSLPPKR